jgi:3-hydroxy-9,10-secoandrosta-1,3,5(10)-triene-9,17-dione monooxygenase
MTTTIVDTTASHSRLTADSDLIKAATSLIPVLRSRSAETDRLARLPDATIADLEKARLFDLLVPWVYGGLQTSFRTLMNVVVELGRGDGSTAWAVALLAGGTWSVAALFPKQVSAEVFAGGGKLRIAGAFNPHNVKTRQVDGGVVIEEGLWHFNSGVYHAQWDGLGIPILNDAGKIIDSGSALIPVSQVTLLHNWDTIGLRGSGSTSVVVKDVFVPNERISSLSKVLQDDYASSHLRDQPLYRIPLIPFLVTKLVFPALGMAKAALEMFVEKASHRSIPYTFYEKQDEAAVTHLQVAEAAGKIDMAELMIGRCVDDIDEYAASNRKMPREVRARIWRDSGASSRLLWEAVDLLAGASGGSFVNVNNPMSRLWRDIRVAGMHGGLCTSSSMEIFGRVLFGKSPNSLFI